MAAGLGLSSCAGHPLPPIAPPAAPLAEAQVKTAGEAQAIALGWVAQGSSEARHLRLNEVSVQELPAAWEVLIHRNDNRKPGGALIVVDKRPGRPVRVPLK